MEKGARYFVLDAEGISCGCVALEPASPEVCYLERLAVLPPQRRRGYGKALVDRVLHEAKELGAQHVDIGIIAEHTELREWYRKIGFVEQTTATFPHLPFQVLFMSLALPCHGVTTFRECPKSLKKCHYGDTRWVISPIYIKLTFNRGGSYACDWLPVG